MAARPVEELKAKSDAAWDNLARQVAGMEPYLERSDAPDEWTTREVLSHLLGHAGWDVVAELKAFDRRTLPVIEIEPGSHYMTPERRRMSLRDLMEALDRQRRSVFQYLDTLAEGDLDRKARIPLFKEFMGTDEIPITMFVGAVYDYHLNDHAGQLAKIRKAVGLPDAA